jgi:uncharacterized membrane protein HdeD (DUF308 family)
VKDTSGPLGWIVLMARGVIAAALALTLTFLPDHSSAVGFLSIGIFGILTGAAIGAGAMRNTGGFRRGALILAVVFVVGGIAHLALIASPVSVLLFAASVVFAVAGALELVSGLRARNRDHVFLGAVSAVLSVVAVVTPADYLLAYTVNEETRTMTASVILVGALGIYAAVLAVYLIIAALSLKWTQGTSPTTSGNTK